MYTQYTQVTAYNKKHIIENNDIIMRWMIWASLQFKCNYNNANNKRAV